MISELEKSDTWSRNSNQNYKNQAPLSQSHKMISE